MSDLSRLQRQQKLQIHCMNKVCNDEPVACPFCKSTHVDVIYSDTEMIDAQPARCVECKNCYARGPLDTTDVGAIHLWNKYTIMRSK